MSKFGDKIRSAFTVDYDDDDYDEFYDDFEDEDLDDIKPEPAPAPKKRKVEKVKEEKEEPVRSSSRVSRASSNYRSSSRSSRNNKVVPMRSNSDMEVCVIKPTHYEATKEIIDTLLDGKAVVLNLEGIKIDLAQRIIDSVIGGCYALDGNLQKISGYIYLVTPSSVDITGDFQDVVSDAASSDYSANYQSSYQARKTY